MKFVILILTFFSFYANDKYQISFDIFLSVDISFDLDSFNIANKYNLFYSGSIEDIQDILNISIISKKEKKIIIKEGNHPLVYIIDNYNINYINLFPTTTIFIILKDCIKYLNDEYKNYNIFILDNNYEYEFSIYNDYFSEDNFSYVKFGKKIDEAMNINFYILILISIFISLLISIIIRKLKKRINLENQLPINSNI